MFMQGNGGPSQLQRLRFRTEKDRNKGCWLVYDSFNRNAIVGIHASATMAALDACKREQDIMPPHARAAKAS